MTSAEAIPHGEKKESVKELVYNFRTIESIEGTSKKLVEDLKESIDNEEYDVLIGDDASGRIPTLLLWNIMKERMREKHPDWDQEKQREALQTYFMAGGAIGNSNYAELRDFFMKIKPKISKNALLITEYISSGLSISRIGALLEELEIPFDIATLSSALSSAQPHSASGVFSRHKIFKGDATWPPAIYGDRNISGVTKRGAFTPQMAHAVPTGSSLHVAMAREDIKTLSDKILKEVWGK